MLSKFQSGFRRNHSTATALIQMCDEWLKNFDNGKLNGAVFHDIKKAFDSVNHGTLLKKMNEQFGISGMELKWFESYLLHVKQQCLVNGQLSSTRTIICRVPQGSILEFLARCCSLCTLTIYLTAWDQLPHTCTQMIPRSFHLRMTLVNLLQILTLILPTSASGLPKINFKCIPLS